MVALPYYVAVLLGSAAFTVGIIYLLKNPFANLVESSLAQLNILLDNTLDEEEQDGLILKNLVNVLKWLFICLILLVVLVGIGILPVYIYQMLTKGDIDTSSLFFFGTMILGSCVLFFFKSKGDYSYWDKLIHGVILNNYALEKYLFNREIKNAPEINTAEQEFVIVTGLARGGTTALTNMLYDETKFHSIKYNNVPFLLAPNLWKKVYNPKKVKERERAHGDKVLFSENSIEALEEHFFKAQLNDSYVHEETLDIHSISDDLFEQYLKYQELFKTQDGTTYLAKNNNFILRYNSLFEKNKAFKVVMMFRDPVQHAYSLLKQHKNFIQQQSEDAFVEQYMTWLGHYEFGLNQKVFDLNGSTFTNDANAKLALSYWIDIWTNYYSYVLSILENSPNIILVNYDDLADQPSALKTAINNRIGINLEVPKLEPFKANKKVPQELSEVNLDQLNRAEDIYKSLMTKKLNV